MHLNSFGPVALILILLRHTVSRRREGRVKGKEGGNGTVVASTAAAAAHLSQMHIRTDTLVARSWKAPFNDVVAQFMLI